MANPSLYSFAHAITDERYQVSSSLLAELGVQVGEEALIDAPRLKQLQNQLAKLGLKPIRNAGGSAANSFYHAAKNNVSAELVCTLADDANGNAFIAQTQSEQLTLAASYKAGTSGTSLILIDESGERSMLTCLGNCADITPEQIDFDKLAQADWLYLEGYLLTQPHNLALALQCIQHARQHQVKVAFSFSDPAMVRFFAVQAKEIIATSPDVIFCNQDEFALLTGEEFNVDAAQDYLQHCSPTSHLVVTQGAKGASYISLNSHIFKEINKKVTLVDTNGAGDAFAGGALAALAQGKESEQVLALGEYWATNVVAQINARVLD